MNAQADPYREWDVAYLLGSVSRAERREFELHLTECSACASNVGTLAGIPGILSVVPHESALGLPEPGGAAPGIARRPMRSRQLGGVVLVGVVIAVVMWRKKRGSAG